MVSSVVPIDVVCSLLADEWPASMAGRSRRAKYLSILSGKGMVEGVEDTKTGQRHQGNSEYKWELIGGAGPSSPPVAACLRDALRMLRRRVSTDAGLWW